MSNPSNQVERSNHTLQSAAGQTPVGSAGSSRVTRHIVDPANAASDAIRSPIEMVPQTTPASHSGGFAGIMRTAQCFGASRP
jgi:hypothetical protein